MAANASLPNQDNSQASVNRTHHHEHDHHHGHSHHHMPNMQKINTAFKIGIALNTAFLLIEFIVGYRQGSLSLISDAGHNATDVFSLLVSLFAFKMMQTKPNKQFTYGFKKGTILASLFNALLLLVTVFFIFYEAFLRIGSPVPLQGNVISIVALIGVAINGFSAYLFFKDQKMDINIKGAYLHMVSDALVSVGVVIGGILINFTQWFLLDTIISIIIGLVILKSTWGLLIKSIHMALDAMPEDVDLSAIQGLILKYPIVSAVHHIHIWPISSTENALTAHLVLKEADLKGFEAIRASLRHDLLHANVHHTTFELESSPCDAPDCDELPKS